RQAGGEQVERAYLSRCELRFVPDELKEFADVRELDLSGNEVKTFPAWIGNFAKLEVLKAEGCGLNTLPVEIARLQRLRELELADNPITSLPFGPGAFSAVEILTIGQICQSEPAAEFTANLHLSLFPRLRVIEQNYAIKEIDDCRSQDLWSNPHLEILL